MASLNSDGSLNFDDNSYDPNDPNNPYQLPRNPVYGQPSMTSTASGATTSDAGSLGSKIAGGSSVGAQGDPGQGNTSGSTSDPMMAWIQGQLTAANSTDDPNYWYGVMKQDPNAMGSAQSYWAGRIAQGDGAAAVKAGTTQPFNDSSPAPAPTSGPPDSGGGSDPLSTFLQNWLQSQQPNAQTTADRSSLLQRLLGLADQYSQPVTAQDPTIAAAADAYHGTSARSVNAYREMAAERANAEGVPTGAFDSQIGNAQNTAGENEANYTTSLMNTEMQSRRSALMSVLQNAGGLMSAEDQSDIQNKIAAIDSMLSEQQIEQTGQLGGESLSLEQLLGEGALGNQSTSINNQNNQFYDQLGTGNALSEAQLNFLYSELGLSS